MPDPFSMKTQEYILKVQTVGGLTMLVAQAKRAEELFRNIEIADSKIDEVTYQIRNMMEQNR